MAALPKKKRSKLQKMTLKQRIVAAVVIVVPALIVIGWLVMTIVHNPPAR